MLHVCLYLLSYNARIQTFYILSSRVNYCDPVSNIFIVIGTLSRQFGKRLKLYTSANKRNRPMSVTFDIADGSVDYRSNRDTEHMNGWGHSAVSLP